MEKPTLELIAKLVSYGSDDEMVKLGQSIFAQSNPTEKDIDELNNLRGFNPIMYTYEDTQTKVYIANSDRLFDIF